MFSSYAVMAIDDEAAALRACQLNLVMGGIENVICCQDGRQAIGVLAREKVGAVLLDLVMPHVSGQEILAQITQEHPHVPVIIVTSANDIDTAVSCMRAGAFDYMLKPIERSRLLSGVQRALEVCDLRRTCSSLADRLLCRKIEHPEAFRAIITQDPAMMAVFQCTEAIAVSSRPVLVTGETGVGKELIARAIHTLSGRPGKFVAVNVAGLDDALFSDTLFGHRKGAFTGADSDRQGLISEAATGTLFLDEIGDLSPIAQIKLLRLIQEYEYMPLGSNSTESADVRLVVATHCDLDALQESAKFRKDLYYRLKCHHIHIPPLRERRKDVPMLVEQFLASAAAAMGKRRPTPPKELFDLLSTYSFPGNVRELESMIFDAVSKHTGGVLSTITFAEHIKPVKGGLSAVHKPIDLSSPFLLWPQLPTLEEADCLLVAEAVRRANGKQTVAARLLGISQPALSKRLKAMSVRPI